MRYGSVCSGIGGAEVAFGFLGWECAFMSEIDPFARAVLSHHYPTVSLHGDFTTIQPEQYGAIDLLVGGTPCQAFSAQGLRGGLADDRGALTLAFIRLVSEYRAGGFVWENVPGVLSIDGGRVFGAFLGAMEERGYQLAYRVLDARYHGSPQRRRRVYVVGSAGGWSPAEALFDDQSLFGDTAEIQGAQDASPVVAFSYKDSGADASGVAPTMRALNHHHANANAGSHIAFADGEDAWKASVIECERLQAFPDGYTYVPVRTLKSGRVVMAADGPRYRSLGNSMNTAVLLAIGRRIDALRQRIAA